MMEGQQKYSEHILPNNSGSNLITVYSSMSVPEIYVIQGMLEAEGIPSFAKDELITQTAPYLSSLTNGINLQVRQCDIVRTVELLQEAGYLKPSVNGHNKTGIRDAIIFIVLLLLTLIYLFYKNKNGQ